MADPSSEEEGILREWTPLLPLLSQIPHKAQRGLFTGDLNLTCISALPDYLAIGTNHGLVYWYNRFSNEIQRLRCENTVCAITCIAAISTVDYMIAAGTSTGVVTVFLVPKASPENIPEVFKSNTQKQVERYTVGGLHSSSVSALEWSPNGMKLFSGDQNGIVVLTEIDFYMHLSKSVEIFNEKYEVVQLSYNSSNQLLLVSTLFRTILCSKDSSHGTWKVSQVGNKERKILGKMGATFCNNLENPRCPVVYCSRPGLRMWTANKDGIVEKTLMFKDSLGGHHSLIPLLNPTKSRARQSRSEPQLGPLLLFKDRLLVTYTPDALLILDPNAISVVAALYDVQRISALCVTKSEIFVLEGERHLIRLGYFPENVQMTDSTSSKSGPLVNHFLELTAKLRDTSIIPAIPIKKLSPIFSPTKSSGSSDSEQISECVEAQELPPVVSLASLDLGSAEGLPELRIGAASLASQSPDKEVYSRAQRSSVVPHSNAPVHSEILDKIAQEQFEEIVFQPKKRTKKIRSKRGTSTTQGTESGSDTTSVVSTTSENDEAWAYEQIDANSEWNNNNVSTSRRSSVDTQFRQAESNAVNPGMSLPLETKTYKSSCEIFDERLDVMSTQSMVESFATLPLNSSNTTRSSLLNLEHVEKEDIEQTVVAKERMVAKKYNLESVLGITSEKNELLDNAENHAESELSEVLDSEIEEQKNDTQSVEDSEESTLQSVSGIDSLKSTSEGSDCFQDDKMTSLSSTLSYGPPSGSSQIPSRHSSLDLEPTGIKDEVANTAVRREAMEASGWLQFSTPQPVVWVSVCSHYLIAIDSSEIVHYCGFGGPGLKWQRADCKAAQLVISPNVQCVWRLHNNTVYALRNPSTAGPHGEEWLQVTSDVRSVAVGEDIAWFLTQEGEIYCQKELTADSPTSESIKIEKPCEWPLVKIVCFSQLVWLLSSTGEVYVRLGVSSVKPEGVDWKRVNIPVPGSVVDISLGPQRTGWIIDNSDTVMFSVDHLEHDPHWWEVLISDYIFQQTSPLQRLRSKITLKNLRPALLGRQAPLFCIACGKDSIWMIQPHSNTVHANKTQITGHSWTRVKLKGSPTSVRWQSVSAEGIFESGGQLWLLSANGDLYCSQPYNNKNLKQIKLPTSDGAVCLAASSQSLWVLTSSGKIYIRQGLNDMCLEGTDWMPLSLMQIEEIHLTHVSCGLDVVWACDTKGNMYMTVSSPHAMATTASFSPVWILVSETKEQKKIFFIKVFVGSQSYMVWALDNKGKIYVREAIFPDYPIGTDWVAVTGITVVDLSVSATAVWALSVDGDVYKRHGITQNNYIGDYWKKIPGSVEALTASMCDRLWGIDKSGSLLRHTQLTVNLNPSCGNPAISQPIELPHLGEEGDWEVVEITNPVVI